MPKSRVQERGDIRTGRSRVSALGSACSTTALCWPSREPWVSMTGTPHRMLPALALNSGGA